ncbi:unnamed protein product [Leptosia nina]|uniref:Uncharacterized protein n=1 Tax=Leptosia nina TaxID=320188 RepID=A0AAV1JGL7_9NEOP
MSVSGWFHNDEACQVDTEGIPELDVPGIEPLSLGQIALARGPQGAKLTAVVNDVKVRGPSNFKITELKSDLNKNRFDFKILLPKLEFAGKYKMDIQVLLLRLQGRGNITGSFKDYACNVTMRGHKEKRGDNEYLKFDPMKVKLRVGDSSIYLTNLFDGDPVLGPATNRVINENSQVFLSEISPVMEKTDYFPQCKKSDPQIEKCILDAIETLRPKLLKGIPEVNVPSLEPFNVPTLKLDRTATNLRLKATIKNMKAYGGSNFKIEKLKLNLNDKYEGQMKLTLPKLSVVADYDVRGSKILTLDISGKGQLRSNFTGITVVVKGAARVIERDGVEYLQADKMIAKLKIAHGQLAVEDTERPVAATSAAAFFNASPGVILDILNPLIEESSAAIFKAFFNKILATIPLQEILVA